MDQTTPISALGYDSFSILRLSSVLHSNFGVGIHGDYHYNYYDHYKTFIFEFIDIPPHILMHESTTIANLSQMFNYTDRGIINLFNKSLHEQLADDMVFHTTAPIERTHTTRNGKGVLLTGRLVTRDEQFID